MPWRYQFAIGRFSSGLLVHWTSLLVELSLSDSLWTLFLAPSLRSLFHVSPSNRCAPFYSLAENPLSFSRFIPSKSNDLPLQQPPRHFWARQESLCNWHHSARVTGTKRRTLLWREEKQREREMKKAVRELSEILARYTDNSEIARYI